MVICALAVYMYQSPFGLLQGYAVGINLYGWADTLIALWLVPDLLCVCVTCLPGWWTYCWSKSVTHLSATLKTLQLIRLKVVPHKGTTRATLYSTHFKFKSFETFPSVLRPLLHLVPRDLRDSSFSDPQSFPKGVH